MRAMLTLWVSLADRFGSTHRAAGIRQLPPKSSGLQPRHRNRGGRQGSPAALPNSTSPRTLSMDLSAEGAELDEEMHFAPLPEVSERPPNRERNAEHIAQVRELAMGDMLRGLAKLACVDDDRRGTPHMPAATKTLSNIATHLAALCRALPYAGGSPHASHQWHRGWTARAHQLYQRTRPPVSPYHRKCGIRRLPPKHAQHAVGENTRNPPSRSINVRVPLRQYTPDYPRARRRRALAHGSLQTSPAACF